MSKRTRSQGAIDVLILKTLMQGPMHGFGITTYIQEVSHGMLEVEEGSLYPALKRLELEGFLTSEWRTTDNNRRARFYSLTKAGRRQFEHELSQWNKTNVAVALVLNAS